MIETPQIVHAPAQQVAILHIATPRAGMQQVMGPGIAEVMTAVREQGIGPTGPWFAHHLKMSPGAFDFDICVPVSSPVMAVGRVKPGQRPAIKVARTVYHGPYEGLGQAWAEFAQWMKDSGCKVTPDLYEAYLVGPEAGPDSANWRTELSQPVVG
jgi:effector-binding domain-containing protein